MLFEKPKKKIRYAVVGLGYIAQDAVLPAFRNAQENSELVALVSGDKEKLKRLGEEYNIEKCYLYSEFEQCLRNGEVDAIYICTPNFYHRNIMEMAAKYGIHVLCEKPMAVTTEDCLSMINEAEKHHIISNASCTTNCLVPMVKVIRDAFGRAMRGESQIVTDENHRHSEPFLQLDHMTHLLGHPIEVVVRHQRADRSERLDAQQRFRHPRRGVVAVALDAHVLHEAELHDALPEIGIDDRAQRVAVHAGGRRIELRRDGGMVHGVRPLSRTTRHGSPVAGAHGRPRRCRRRSRVRRGSTAAGRGGCARE